VRVSSNKGGLGHLLGAAGAVESVLTTLACQRQVALPSLNVDSPDAEFNDLNIGKLDSDLDLKNDSKSRIIALKNSFGFGGTNASLCIASFVE